MNSTFYDNDRFRKNILDGGSLDFGPVEFTRPYSFSLNASQYSLTSRNYFVHSFDSTIYPAGTSSVTGFSVFATSSNSFSSHFYVALMQLYNRGALWRWDGIFATTSLTSAVASTTAELYFGSGKFSPEKAAGDFNKISLSSFSATLSGIFIWAFDRSIFGSGIKNGTAALYTTSSTAAVAFDGGSPFGEKIVSLTSSYSDSSVSATRLWLLPDVGIVVGWSSDNSRLSSFSAISTINFRNSVEVMNFTANLRIEPDEFNHSENPSFYFSEYSKGQQSDAWFTTIGLYNRWNELVAVAKCQRPIRKTGVPITIRLVFDLI